MVLRDEHRVGYPQLCLRLISRLPMGATRLHPDSCARSASEAGGVSIRSKQVRSCEDLRLRPRVCLPRPTANLFALT
jgi:hypothetical protein